MSEQDYNSFQKTHLVYDIWKKFCNEKNIDHRDENLIPTNQFIKRYQHKFISELKDNSNLLSNNNNNNCNNLLPTTQRVHSTRTVNQTHDNKKDSECKSTIPMDFPTLLQKEKQTRKNHLTYFKTNDIKLKSTPYVKLNRVEINQIKSTTTTATTTTTTTTTNIPHKSKISIPLRKVNIPIINQKKEEEECNEKKKKDILLRNNSIQNANPSRDRERTLRLTRTRTRSRTRPYSLRKVNIPIINKKKEECNEKKKNKLLRNNSLNANPSRDREWAVSEKRACKLAPTRTRTRLTSTRPYSLRKVNIPIINNKKVEKCNEKKKHILLRNNSLNANPSRDRERAVSEKRTRTPTLRRLRTRLTSTRPKKSQNINCKDKSKRPFNKNNKTNNVQHLDGYLRRGRERKPPEWARYSTRNESILIQNTVVANIFEPTDWQVFFNNIKKDKIFPLEIVK